jgi:hypothetical protein
MAVNDEERGDRLPWRMLLRLPADWGADIEALAARSATPKAVLVRQLIRQGLDRERRGTEAER